jgi:hypothetical protein
MQSNTQQRTQQFLRPLHHWEMAGAKYTASEIPTTISDGPTTQDFIYRERTGSTITALVHFRLSMRERGDVSCKENVDTTWFYVVYNCIWRQTHLSFCAMAIPLAFLCRQLHFRESLIFLSFFWNRNWLDLLVTSQVIIIRHQISLNF